MTDTPRDYATAAAELGCSEEWLRDATPTVPLPHHKFSITKTGEVSKKGRGPVVFYDDDIKAIREMFAVKSPAAAPVSTRPLTRRRAS